MFQHTDTHSDKESHIPTYTLPHRAKDNGSKIKKNEVFSSHLKQTTDPG